MSNKHKKLKWRVAVLPVKIEKDKKRCKKNRKIYLVTSREQGQWIIPTGKLEKNLSNRRVALLEAFEEAGLLGKLDARFKLHVLLKSPRGKVKRKTIVFLLYVDRILNRWPEKNERKRKAISIKSYINSVPGKKLRKKLMKKLMRI